MMRVIYLLIVAAVWAAVLDGPTSRLAAAQGAGEGHSAEITESGEVITPSAPVSDGLTSATPATMALANAKVSSSTLALLRRLEETRKDTRTIHATFHQVRVDESFMDETESDGELWFRKPDHLRCDYADPQKMINLVVDKEFYIYVPELEQAEYYRFESAAQRDQQLHELLIAFGFKTDELAERYAIRSSEDDPEVEAELRKAKMDPAKHALFVILPRPAYAETCPFTILHVFLDKEKLEPVRIWYKDQSFDANMTLEMKKIELDAPVKDELFDPKKIFKPGTEIIDKRNQ